MKWDETSSRRADGKKNGLILSGKSKNSSEYVVQEKLSLVPVASTLNYDTFAGNFPLRRLQ